MDQALLQEAQALHDAVGLIDLHVDTILSRRLFRYNPRRSHRALLKGQPLLWHADIPRMLEAGYGGACLGIHYWPWEGRRAFKELSRQVEIARQLAADDRCHLVREPADWDQAEREGKLALAPAVEGAHMLVGDLGRVAQMRRLGVVYLTLTHFSRNSAATPAMGRGNDETSGLTDFGRELVRALNEAGIAIDLSHVNMPGAIEAARLSQSPVMATHTGARTLHQHPRLLNDEAIDAIADTDGVIGVMAAPGFLGKGWRAGTGRILDHYDYLKARIGARHLAFGSDYDGWLPRIPNDQRDCRDAIRVTAGLLQRGYTEDELRGILRDNALRVFQAVWAERSD